MKKWVLIAVAVSVGLIAVVALIGALLPKNHLASRTVRFNQSPETLWEVLTNHPAEPSWRSDLARVEQLPDVNGHALWREVFKNGEVMTLETVEAIPPHRLVRRIADKSLPFGGSWTIEREKFDPGSRVTVMENGEVYNPIFRFVSRFIIGHTATIDRYLAMVGKKFGEEPKPEK